MPTSNSEKGYDQRSLRQGREDWPQRPHSTKQEEILLRMNYNKLVINYTTIYCNYNIIIITINI